jgi:hypothetical protein
MSAPSAGLEPAHTASEADALSAELRGLAVRVAMLAGVLAGPGRATSGGCGRRRGTVWSPASTWPRPEGASTWCSSTGIARSSGALAGCRSMTARRRSSRPSRNWSASTAPRRGAAVAGAGSPSGSWPGSGSRRSARPPTRATTRSTRGCAPASPSSRPSAMRSPATDRARSPGMRWRSSRQRPRRSSPGTAALGTSRRERSAVRCSTPPASRRRCDCRTSTASTPRSRR